MIEKIRDGKKFFINSTLAFIMFFILLPIAVQSINLGVLQKNTESNVRRGETAEFTIFFWSIEDSPSLIKLRVKESPENMSVIIKPDEFLLNSSTGDYSGGEREYVNTPQGLKLMTPVKILAKVSEKIKYGDYVLSVVVTAGQPQGGVSTVIEKTFLLEVHVVSVGFFEKVEEGVEKTSGLISDVIKKITGMVSAVAEGNNILLLFASAIVIIVVYWMIKRRL
jgi:hypothetical protein